MEIEIWSTPAERKVSLWRRLSPPQLFAGLFTPLIVAGKKEELARLAPQK